MEQVRDNTSGFTSRAVVSSNISAPGYQAYQILRLGFTVAPILAGLDKFFNLLVNWEQYLPSFVNRLTGGHGHELMIAVGIIEIVAGAGGGVQPKIFFSLLFAWCFLFIIHFFFIFG